VRGELEVMVLKNLLEMTTWWMNFAMSVEFDSELVSYTDEIFGGMVVLLKT